MGARYAILCRYQALGDGALLRGGGPEHEAGYSASTSHQRKVVGMKYHERRKGRGQRDGASEYWRGEQHSRLSASGIFELDGVDREFISMLTSGAGSGLLDVIPRRSRLIIVRFAIHKLHVFIKARYM